MAVTSLSTYAAAIAAGNAFWRLQITNWGNRETGADANSIQYVEAPVQGVQYLAIGPDSTADEVIITYADPSLAQRAFTVPNPGFLNAISMTIGITKPGIVMPGPLTVRTALSTQFGDAYIRDGNPASQPFGGTEALFEAPTLQLLAYPETPTVPVSNKRNDMYRSSQVASAGDVGVEQLIGIWPVMGRSCKSIYFQGTGTLAASVRVGGIATYVLTSVGLPVPRTIEDTVGTATVDATTGTQASLSTGRPMQWLAAYMTRTGGAGSMTTILTASDCG
jgi:hypothetical protein